MKITKDKRNKQVRLHGLAKRKRGSRLSGEERTRRDVDSQLFPFNVYEIDWYYQYVSNPGLEGNTLQRKFRRRFWCIYNKFVKHLDKMKRTPLFKQWEDGQTDVFGFRSSPIRLLLLGVLHYLGCGWCCDGLSEQTCNCE